ncbi:AAA family ATPase [Oceanobacter sp. 4_MG-2023]|uniref:AAA family ATPase n=1 Tax=Oceanobacter sp. 4_MG-2023 TaxID=3062623 RepID=UPI0027336CDE|nr:AAA family ATPase [Oceanobacter sp. 4_MG-2023]MDP2548431.1 AAA family ATPase [Oceanobacter sp. 4_MG-2023]
MARIYLIEGPVGAGKSTFSENLSQKIKAPHINLDSWMARLFRPDRPATGTIEWYVERKERCIEQIWDVALRIMEAECDVILELGLVQCKSRHAMYERIEESGHNILVYVLDAPREERRERVRLRNIEKGDTFSMEVPDAIFEIASDMWEEPNDIECDKYEVVFVPQTTANKALHRTSR